MNDTDYLYSILRDGKEHELSEIIAQSQRERGFGMTVHSRAADLRKRGYWVAQRSERRHGRVRSYYHLPGWVDAKGAA